MSDTAKSGRQAVAYRARWVFPVDQPPLEGGVVTIAKGRIVAVGANDSGQPVRDLGDVAILPGLVNAHTHLEFSLLNRPLGPAGMPFPAWLSEVVGWRAKLQQQFSEDEMLCYREGAIAAGWVESSAAGVAALGEIARLETPIEAYGDDERTMTVRLFCELLGLSAERVDPLMRQARAYLDRNNGGLDHVRPGISPHATYTVHPDLLLGACELSAQSRTPVAMHVAESRDELELLSSQSGPLVEFLKGLGAWHAAALPWGLRPLDYLQTLATAHQALVIHGNYLAADEIDFLAAHRDRLSLVYCPRTHAYFGHAPYPLSAALAAGARVAVGTDSRASNPDLSLFAELRHIAHCHPAVSPDAILQMGTLAGAEALGITAELGSITPGKRAQLLVAPLPHPSTLPLDDLLDSTCNPQWL